MFKYEIGTGPGLKHTKMAGASRIASEELFGRAAFTKFWGGGFTLAVVQNAF